MKEAADERTSQNRKNNRKMTKKEIATEEQLSKLYNELFSQLKTIDHLTSLKKLANARMRWKQLFNAQKRNNNNNKIYCYIVKFMLYCIDESLTQFKFKKPNQKCNPLTI